jgi:P-type Cu+ transporter
VKRACDHCHLEYDSNILISEIIDGNTHFFCCQGCQGVYHLLLREGLNSFYSKLGSTTLDPVEHKQDDVSRFDSDALHQRYVQNANTLSSIALVIEGIHCTACVWLNETILLKTDGILEVDIHYTNNKATLVWDSSKISLSQIITTIRSIGYDAYPYDPKTQEYHANTIRKEYYTRMIVGIFCTMNIMWLSIAQYAGYFTGILPEVKALLHTAEWALATPALFYSGWIFFKGAYQGVKHRLVTMDLLVASGASLTYGYSVYVMWKGDGETYFESATMIITFVLIGKFFEVRSKKSAIDTLDTLNAQVPTQATRIQGDSVENLAVEEVEIGDLLELKAGEKAAIDGVLVSSEALFDESSITGESNPVEKHKNDEILSGSVNVGSVALYKAIKDFSHSLLHTLVMLVEDSIRHKPMIEEKANALSRHFSLVILCFACLTMFGWWWFKGDFEHALMIGVSVIVIACPCALALATPIATLVGMGESFSRGILYKEAKHLETMAKCDVLLLDKTGTITEGCPCVVDFWLSNQCDIRLIFALVSRSKHPVSQGICSWLQSQYNIHSRLEIEAYTQVSARGLKGVYDGNTVLGGNALFMQEMGVAVGHEENRTHFFFALDGVLLARFALQDRPKKHAKISLKRIQEMGVRVIMLTGDHEKVARSVASAVGIDEVHANLLPQDKATMVDSLHQAGHTVVMAGDGINDTLALSKSDIAIAMGSGVDIARDISDVIIMHDSMTGIHNAFLMSRRTYLFVKQNLGISLCYNALTIPLAMGGYVIPLIAALSMSVSSLLVVANSLRIKQVQGSLD